MTRRPAIALAVALAGCHGSKEEKTLNSIGSVGGRFGDFLQGTRGIELSKTGRVYDCRWCRRWLPLPNEAVSICPHCKMRLSILAPRVTSIVSSERSPGLMPLLVGESIRRYNIGSKYWIDVQKQGINYKAKETYAAPKLLVRKTGVGVSAAIDYSRSYTNQVVYIFHLKNDAPLHVPLELFLAVLNSRAIYYFLAKNHGETEWRSHPYLTQKQILSLPSPDTHALSNGSKSLISEVVGLLKPYTTRNLAISPEIDAKVERIVARLYDLDRSHYVAIYKTLDEVQDLLPVRALKNITVGDIFS